MRFEGQKNDFSHQHFKMVNVLINHFEQNTPGSNPHASPYVPIEKVDAEHVNESRDEKSVEEDKISEEKSEVELEKKKHHNKKHKGIEKWMHDGRMFRSIQKLEPKLKIKKATM